MTSATVTTPKAERRQAVMAVLGTTCALTLAVALGLWQSGAFTGTTTRAVPQSDQRAPDAIVHAGNRPDIDIPADGPQSGAVALSVQPAIGASTLYLVATTEAADALRARMGGDLSGRIAIIVPGSAEETRLLAAIANADAASAELGLPTMDVVDLRG